MQSFTESVSGHRMKLWYILKCGRDFFKLNSNLIASFVGEGVGVAYSSFQEEVEVYDVDYCGYVQLRRPIFKKDQSFTAGEFEAVIHNGQTGIKCTQKNKTSL